MFSLQIHKNLYVLGLCLLAFGMMMGRVPTSVPEIILGANWVLEMDFKRKWQQLKSNKIFWLLFGLFLIHLPGLIYTNNLSSGLNDLKIKLPLLAMSLILFSSKALLVKEWRWVFIFFIIGCVCNVSWCLVYNFVLHTNEYHRETSRFMSHIWLGLYLSVGIFACIWLVKEHQSTPHKLLFVVAGFYLLAVLFILGLISGLFIFFSILLIALFFFLHRQKVFIRWASYLALITGAFICYNYAVNVVKKQLALNETANNKIQKFNSVGREYVCFSVNGQKENGNYVLINIQPNELQREWKRLAPADSFNYSQQYNLGRYEILIRYLASKGLNKDSVGISKLSANDIQNIQKNITNYLYPEWGYLQKRIYELINEGDDFRNNRHVSGRSLTMRLYFWKAALYAISKNYLFGVGTGDVQDVLNETYVETKSPLQKEWYKRPHNQFLTFLLAGGVIGLIIFLLVVFYPALHLTKQFHVLFWPFYIILIYSFLFEDSLETQAGATFYAFFYSLFVSQAWFAKNDTEQNLGQN